MALATPLEAELKVFEEHRRDWSKIHPGKFVVIQDKNILEGFFEDYSSAFKAGLLAFGVGRNYLVKQIWIEEPVYFVG